MAGEDGSDLLCRVIKTQITRYLPEQGRAETEIPGLALTRYDTETTPGLCFCSPMIAFVAQGRKSSFYSNRETNYGEGQCVVLGIDTPCVYQIANASPNRPFLSLSIKLNGDIISGLFADLPDLSRDADPEQPPLGVMEPEPALLDAFRRMLNLLEAPERIPVFAPMLLKEIHFYILTSSLGAQLRLFNTSGTLGNRISKAIAWLRANFRASIRVEDVAARANMATSTFNRYFRSVTGLSPLQFQKRLRLHEAERLMLMEKRDVASAAMAVGYESGSQFAREYRKLFGTPPGRDMERRRAG